jgi:hypothetical protein
VCGWLVMRFPPQRQVDEDIRVNQDVHRYFSASAL